MKKLITIMCVAAAPILFAQEKSAKASETVKTEQAAKKENATKIQANKKSEADKKAAAEKKATQQKEVKAVDNKNSATKASAVNSKKK